MFLRSFKLLAATLIAGLILVSCGGDSAPAPTGLRVMTGDSTATVSWDMVDGVEYWLFFGPTSVAPTDTTSMQKWIGLPGGNVLLKVSSPYLVTGLVNGIPYSFSVNGRTGGGPGGSGAAPASAISRIAGATWVAGPANSSGSHDLHSVTYGSSVTTTTLTSTIYVTATTTTTTYVAAGLGGAMYSSPDGATWSAINYATSNNLNGASYFGTYKLVGDSGVVLVSSDAVSWTAQPTPTTKNLYAIASNGINLNVAVGAGGTIITSPDGVTWSLAANSATSSDLYAVTYSAYNSGTWVAVGAGGTIVESTDGLTWHSVASNTVADLRGVAYGASTSAVGATTLVAVGDSGTLLSSTDGSNWVAQVLPGVTALNAVIYGNQFVTVGSGGNIFISTDGLDWTLTPPATNKDLYAVVHGLYLYSAVGAAGTNLLAK